MSATRPAPAPVPCIRLTTETLQVAAAGGRWDEIVAPVVCLAFDYGPRPAGVAAVRDRRAEAEAQGALERHGALELDGLEDCAAAPGSWRTVRSTSRSCSRRARPRETAPAATGAASS